MNLMIALAGLPALTFASTTNVPPRNLRSQRNKLDHSKIPKYVESLTIPPVLHDASVESSIEVAIRQITQQILPSGYPATTVWAYGNPTDPSTFSYPAGTIETIKDKPVKVTWINQLVKDPDSCTSDSASDACNYLRHVLRDKYAIPIVDQTLHWANPAQALCEDGSHKTDCKGTTADPYWGPIPTTMHLHGAHVDSISDGFPESWFLPDANDIPEGFALHGTYFYDITALKEPEISSDDDDDDLVHPGDDDLTFLGYDDLVLSRETLLGQQYNPIMDPTTSIPQEQGLGSSQQIVATPPTPGQASYYYPNDGPQATLFFHDHTLGLTRLNVYAAGAGFWLVRGKHSTYDLYEYDCEGKKQALPGPPPVYGEDPNGDPAVRMKIREIPLAIQSMSFYDNGALFYPANRLFFDGIGDGDVFAETSGYDVPFRPDTDADVSPIWNPEAFFDTWVVNGKTWPKLEVAPEQYRFRILNLADSTTLNLALKVEKSCEELPFYVIGSDQGYLPYVVKLRTGFFTQITEPGGNNREESQDKPEQALLLMPGERYDVIIDFTGIEDGTEILMINTAPNEPFGGFDDYIPADPESTGQVLKFIVDKKLKNPDGDQSTPATCLRLNPKVTLPEATSTRVLRLLENESKTCIKAESSGVKQVSCNEEKECQSLGPSMALLGYGNAQHSSGNKWKDPIEMNPSLDSTEIVVGSSS